MQFLSLCWENDENKQKEAGLAHFLNYWIPHSDPLWDKFTKRSSGHRAALWKEHYLTCWGSIFECKNVKTNSYHFDFLFYETKIDFWYPLPPAHILVQILSSITDQVWSELPIYPAKEGCSSGLQTPFNTNFVYFVWTQWALIGHFGFDSSLWRYGPPSSSSSRSRWRT